jgi:radical SAM superfamily enzyme YgiQ (UPF0313 family)
MEVHVPVIIRDDILQSVEKPARYTGGELNSIIKDPSKASIRFAFCFPDVYEVGASNLGLEILYHLVNGLSHAQAERCYCPSDDMETLMRQKDIPLFSLESRMPLASFEIVGFSLQYELCATNVLSMLEMARIPIFSKDRDFGFPLVIGGGPMTANPEPVADFFDAIVLGEGEEVIQEIIAAVQSFKKSGSTDRWAAGPAGP